MGADFYKDEVNIERALINGQNPNLEVPSLRIYHQFALLEHVGRSTNIGFPIFELDRLKENEIVHMNSCDKLFICSKWAKEVCLNSGIKPPVEVIPLGVNSEIFHPPIIGKKPDLPFTFFFPGKFEYRKGFDVVVEAFERAFNANDNIEVLFLPQNFFISQKDTEQWINYLTTTKFGPKFKIIGRKETHQEVAEITRNADCVVSFSRAEGWNMPLLEALACGRRVISTNYSAPTEFLNSKNAILIDVSGREEAFDGVFFNGGGDWLSYTDSDISNMAEALRTVYKEGPKFNTAGVETAKQFSWENTARKIISQL